MLFDFSGRSKAIQSNTKNVIEEATRSALARLGSSPQSFANRADRRITWPLGKFATASDSGRHTLRHQSKLYLINCKAKGLRLLVMKETFLMSDLMAQ